jgi:acetate kinase
VDLARVQVLTPGRAAQLSTAKPEFRTLVVNAGSSSLKLALLGDAEDPIAERSLEVPGTEVDPAQLSRALREDGLDRADAVGHRIVHGGERFGAAVKVDQEVREALGELTALAPLHQPKSLGALDAVSHQLPELPAVACFDTAFHRTMPVAARTYPIPAGWREHWGLRRFGFHGLSHAYIARRVPELVDLDPKAAGELRIVSCHLGAGASLCAIAGGRSVDTTMGFTPLEGLVMGTRSGTVDPGMLLWLLQQTSISATELAEGLEHESGLKGLAGSADMRAVMSAHAAGDARAVAAIDVYVHRLRAGIAAMTATLGGVDVLAFTGGIGENVREIRDRTVAGLGFLSPAPQVLTIPAREDLEIASETRALLGA